MAAHAIRTVLCSLSKVDAAAAKINKERGAGNTHLRHVRICLAIRAQRASPVAAKLRQRAQLHAGAEGGRRSIHWCIMQISMAGTGRSSSNIMQWQLRRHLEGDAQVEVR